KAVGIQVTPQNLAATTYQTDLYTGKYQLGYYAETGGPTPHFQLRPWLYSPNPPPHRTPAASDLQPCRHPPPPTTVPQYGTTTSPSEQHSIVNQLQKVMLQDVPVIPITEAVDWFQYDTGSFTGWVTQGNPYAQPSAYNYPDWGQQMMTLQPKS